MKPSTIAVIRAIKIVFSYIGFGLGGIAILFSIAWGFVKSPEITFCILGISIVIWAIWMIAKGEYVKVLEEDKEAERIQAYKEHQVLKMLDPNKNNNPW